LQRNLMEKEESGHLQAISLLRDHLSQAEQDIPVWTCSLDAVTINSEECNAAP
ncbi:hypothetical protein CEXT_701211, partial [Caerostris extrusa]